MSMTCALCISGVGVDDTRMDLSQFDESVSGTGRTAPTTPQPLASPQPVGFSGSSEHEETESSTAPFSSGVESSDAEQQAEHAPM